jgi:hypothetical protein
MTRHKRESAHDYMKAYPRLTGHLICHSLGYALPTVAADIIRAAHTRQKHFCEWIDACYRNDPLPAVRGAIRGRHGHHGYMADYGQARALVQRAVSTGEEPAFASWF